MNTVLDIVGIPTIVSALKGVALTKALPLINGTSIVEYDIIVSKPINELAFTIGMENVPVGVADSLFISPDARTNGISKVLMPCIVSNDIPDKIIGVLATELLIIEADSNNELAFTIGVLAIELPIIDSSCIDTPDIKSGTPNVPIFVIDEDSINTLDVIIGVLAIELPIIDSELIIEAVEMVGTPTSPEFMNETLDIIPLAVTVGVLATTSPIIDSDSKFINVLGVSNVPIEVIASDIIFALPSTTGTGDVVLAVIVGGSTVSPELKSASTYI